MTTQRIYILTKKSHLGSIFIDIEPTEEIAKNTVDILDAIKTDNTKYEIIHKDIEIKSDHADEG